jgi:hypothetical protein
MLTTAVRRTKMAWEIYINIDFRKIMMRICDALKRAECCPISRALVIICILWSVCRPLRRTDTTVWTDKWCPTCWCQHPKVQHNTQPRSVKFILIWYAAGKIYPLARLNGCKPSVLLGSNSQIDDYETLLDKNLKTVHLLVYRCSSADFCDGIYFETSEYTKIWQKNWNSASVSHWCIFETLLQRNKRAK